MLKQALNGIKVLDLTHYIAGPFCTKLLADYGADIIKVEKPGSGDIARNAGPFPRDIPDQEKSGLFLYLNTNKKGVTLNLKTRTGMKIFHQLLEQSDILVESFRPGVMSSFGLDYKKLKKIKPQLVMCSISNYGQTGPYRDWKGNDLILYALSGQMSRNGDPEREPLKHTLNIFQYFAGKTAALVILASALRNLMTAPEGEYIDVSILETIQGDVITMLGSYNYSKMLQERKIAKNFPIFPHGGFPAKDGYVALHSRGGGERWTPRLFEMIDRPDLKTNPQFADPKNRLKNTEEFKALIYSWLSTHNKREIFDKAAAVRYPVGPVYTTAELLSDPHYKKRGFFIDVDHPAAGKLTYPGAPFIMSEGGFAVRMPAPLLGQHNQEIYSGLLGYSDQELAVLRNQDII